jgi:hypothetical protein
LGISVAARGHAASVTQHEPDDRRRWVPWLITLGYVLAAFAITWRIWAHPTVMAPDTGDKIVNGDVLDDFWFMRYPATELAHGHLPALVSTTVNWPQGVNMMWNNALLVAGIALAPLTWLAGPIASLAVLLTAGFALSAIAMYVVLRRWGAGHTGAGIGGAIYGFSPALVVAATDHYQLQFAALPPLMVDAALRLATGRGRPVLTGLWLGLLVSAQLFLGAELLVFAGLAGAVLAVVLAIQRPSVLRANIRAAAAGLGVALIVTGLICGNALLVQLRGPLAQTGSPWHIGRYGTHEADLFTAPYVMLLHGDYGQFMANTKQWPVETYAYLGWPLLIAVAAATIWWWRDIRIRSAGMSFALLELIGLGGHHTYLFGIPVSGYLLPWHWLVKLPMLNQAIVPRLSVLTDGLAAAVVAFAAGHVIAVARLQREWRRPAFACVAMASLAIVLVPLIPRPVPAAAAVPPPPGWSTVLTRLHLKSGAPVFIVPHHASLIMSWQALTNAPISIVGGSCMVRSRTGRGAQCETDSVWNTTEKGAVLGLDRLSDTPPRPGPSRRQVVRALRDLRVGAILCYGGAHSPLANYLTAVLGRPAAAQAGVLGWRLHGSWWRQVDMTRRARHVSSRQQPAALRRGQAPSAGCGEYPGNCHLAISLVHWVRLGAGSAAERVPRSGIIGG